MVDGSAERIWQQDRLLSEGEIGKLKNAGYDIHDIKGGPRTDLYQDREGNVYIKPKGGTGPGEPAGININQIPW